MLDQTEGAIDSAPADEEAREIYLTVRKEVDPGTHNFDNLRHPLNSFESAYTHLGGIAELRSTTASSRTDNCERLSSGCLKLRFI
jgi:hypothetical protein